MSEENKWQAPLWFDGRTYEDEFDSERLGKLMRQVYAVMRDGKWRTLSEIATLTNHGAEASISARLRDLRKPRFGAHEVESKRLGDKHNGAWVYRLDPRSGSAANVESRLSSTSQRYLAALARRYPEHRTAVTQVLRAARKDAEQCQNQKA